MQAFRQGFRQTHRWLRVVVALSFLLASLSPLLLAQQAVQSAAVPISAEPHSFDRGSVGLWQTLQKLHTRASLLMITAHPDDEDGPMLTYESRHEGVRANLLSLTRGEAGQNVMSSDSWDALGLVRTQEMLAADSYYGVHPYWSSVADFGFTKTKAEAYDKWGHDRVLCDTVRVVRLTRPLVVMSVFAGNVSDGHGQHQVSGQAAQEVYKSAGDSNVCPDQIHSGLLPWSPLKVYIRVPFANITDQGVFDYATGHWAPAIFHNYVDGTDMHGKPVADVALPAGQYDPLLGLSYFQLARLGLGQQKSQNDGMGLPLAQPISSEYHLYASRVAVSSHPASMPDANFFDGIDVSLPGIAKLAPTAEQDDLQVQLKKIDGYVDQASPRTPPTIQSARHRIWPLAYTQRIRWSRRLQPSTGRTTHTLRHSKMFCLSCMLSSNNSPRLWRRRWASRCAHSSRAIPAHRISRLSFADFLIPFALPHLARNFLYRYMLPVEVLTP